MARSGRGAALLFWLMTLTAGSALAACLILPAWLEHQAALQLHVRARQQVADLEARLLVLEKQIEHLRHDPAYVERLARKEFGIRTPGVQTIVLDRTEGPASRPTTAPTTTPAAAYELESLPELSTLMAQALERYPATAVFVLDQTRPVVMVMSAIVLLAAILLLRNQRGTAGNSTPGESR